MIIKIILCFFFVLNSVIFCESAVGQFNSPNSYSCNKYGTGVCYYPWTPEQQKALDQELQVSAEKRKRDGLELYYRTSSDMIENFFRRGDYIWKERWDKLRIENVKKVNYIEGLCPEQRADLLFEFDERLRLEAAKNEGQVSYNKEYRKTEEAFEKNCKEAGRLVVYMFVFLCAGLQARYLGTQDAIRAAAAMPPVVPVLPPAPN